MDIEHCLTVQQVIEVAKFTRAADKTLTQRLLSMSDVRLLSIRTLERTTWQKYKKKNYLVGLMKILFCLT